MQKKDFLNRLKSFHLLREPHTPTLSVRRVFLLTILLYKCVNCVSANRAILSGRLQTLCSKSQSQIACYTLYLNAKAVIKLRDKASFYIATQKLACFLITVNKLSLHAWRSKKLTLEISPLFKGIFMIMWGWVLSLKSFE